MGEEHSRVTNPLLPLRALRPLREETQLPHATVAKVAKRVSIAEPPAPHEPPPAFSKKLRGGFWLIYPGPHVGEEHSRVTNPMLPLRALRPLREETQLPHATDAKVAKKVSIAEPSAPHEPPPAFSKKLRGGFLLIYPAPR